MGARHSVPQCYVAFHPKIECSVWECEDGVQVGEQHTMNLETVKPRATGRQKTLYKVQGSHGPQVRGELPFPEVHDDGEEGHDSPVEDAAI